MNKKHISLFLATIMLFSTLALSACGGDNGSSGNDTSAAETTTAAGDDSSASDTESESAETEPAETEPEEYVYVPDPENQYTGAVGLGAWSTSVYYDEFKVRNNVDRQTLYEATFDEEEDPLSAWTPMKDVEGDWDPANAATDLSIADFEGNKVYSFANAGATGVLSTVGSTEWGNYTVSVRGRILDGSEGLQLLFNVKDDKNYYIFNVGGSGNTTFCVQQVVDGTKTAVTDVLPITLEKNAWYTLSVNVGKDAVTGSLDGEQLFQIGGTLPGEEDGYHGMIGMSGWSTMVDFDNVKVTDIKTGEVLYENTFDSDSKEGFKYFTYSGGAFGTEGYPEDAWLITDGVLRANRPDLTGVSVAMGPENLRNYIYELDAMPIEGIEGATIIGAITFNGEEGACDNFMLYNCGGWNNTKGCYQIFEDSTESTGDQLDLTLEYGEWHKLKLVVTDYAVFSYVDGVFMQTYWK